MVLYTDLEDEASSTSSSRRVLYSYSKRRRRHGDDEDDSSDSDDGSGGDKNADGGSSESEDDAETEKEEKVSLLGWSFPDVVDVLTSCFCCGPKTGAQSEPDHHHHGFDSCLSPRGRLRRLPELEQDQLTHIRYPSCSFLFDVFRLTTCARLQRQFSQCTKCISFKPVSHRHYSGSGW